MSADEDTELRDLVAQTLETNGTLGKLRAQLRASVFLALEDQENGQKMPFLNKELRSFLSTHEGKLVAGLVQEFLEFFNLEFTLAVFKPEAGLNYETFKRGNLMKELDIQTPKGQQSSSPLLSYLLQNCLSGSLKSSVNGAGDTKDKGDLISKDLTNKQIDDARKKFDFYDKDGSGTIEKDELRELFLDMFPNFHHNMLERYVNDEFKSVDKDFSNSFYSLTAVSRAIDFDEFLGMYKRLFLFCRTVVAGDVSEIISPSHIPTGKNSHPPSKLSSPQAPSTNTFVQSKASNGIEKHRGTSRGGDSSDIEEDPFFDDHPTSPISFNTLSNELEKTKDNKPEFLSGISDNKDNGKQSRGGMSSLDGLPSLTGGRGGIGSLAGAPPLDRAKSPNNDSHDDFEYEDDFSPEHSVSHKASKAENKTETAENGSIAEEIDEEEIEDISIEADDLLRSDKSGFDDLTTDHSVSQADGGFDYMEDPILP